MANSSEMSAKDIEYDKKLRRAAVLMNEVKAGGALSMMMHKAELMELAPAVLNETIERWELNKTIERWEGSKNG